MRSPSRLTLAIGVLAVCSLLPTALPARAQASAPAEAGLATEEEKILYALGLVVARNIAQLGLSEAELEIVGRGMADSVLGRELQVDLQTYGAKLQAFAQGRIAAAAEAEKAESAEFIAQKAAEEGAVTTDSGLVISEITAGTGASPKATDTVRVHYHGTLRNGTVFDSSRDRGEPAQFALNQVVACWTEGLQLMKVGGTSRLVCPSDIAYGDQGRPGIPPGAALVFEVELLEIVGAGES